MQRRRYIFILLFLFVVFVPPLYAGTNVSGRYAGGGTQVTINLSVTAPPPAAFIVLQQLPSGVQLVSASPAPAGANGQQIKWLFKHPRAGGAGIRMQLSKPVAINQLQGEIRFQHPQNGKMFTQRIQ
jgi:hypothetical protein